MIYLLLIIIICGIAYTIYKLIGMDARAYHVEPFKGLVDEKLFGGSEVLDNLPLRVPLLYLQRRREGSLGEYYLNVLIPLPHEHMVIKTLEEFERNTGLLKITYTTIADGSGETSTRLFHETLIPIGIGVLNVEVVCDPGTQSPGSGIGTGDSDTADPVNGGAATPYLSSNMLGPCTMVYNGGDETVVARVTAMSGATESTTLSADGYLQRARQPSGAVASIAVSDRIVRKVYAP